MADRIKRLGYVTIAVDDLDLMADYYARVVRLEVTARRDDVVFMSGGSDHHWLKLVAADGAPGVRSVSYEVLNEDAWQAIRSDLAKREIAFVEHSDLASDFIDKSLVFKDPAGITVELYTKMASLPAPIAPNGINFDRLIHSLWLVSNLQETLAFYQDLLGFKIADMFEDSVYFLYCADRFHHSLGLAAAPPGIAAPKMTHICFHVRSLDDVMRYRNNALELGLKLEADLLRHPTSGSIGVYIFEPVAGDYSVEFCTAHGMIERDDHVPRIFNFGPGLIDTWQTPLPPPRGASDVPFTERLKLAKSGDLAQGDRQ